MGNFNTWETNGECDFAGDGCMSSRISRTTTECWSGGLGLATKASQILLRHLIVVFAQQECW